MRSLEELGGYDRIRRGHEFTRAVLHYAAAKGRMGDALAFAEQSRAPQRVTEYLKAAVGAGAIDVGSPSPWGGPLASFSVLQEGFFAALASQSAFFRMLEDGALTRLPPNTRAGFLTADATAYAVGLGKPVPLSRLDIASTTIVNQRVASLIVVTEEVLQSSASGAEAAFGRSLRAGVAAVVDSTFLSTIGTGIASITATADPMVDLRSLLNSVATTGAERLFFVMRPNVANLLSTLLASGGNRLFESMTPRGGEMLGVPAVVTTAAPNVGGSPAADSLALVDATGVAANAESIQVKMSRETSIQMEDAPGADALVGSGTNVTSMFQTGSVAIMALVSFGLARFRSNSVAVLDGIAWT